MSNFWSLWVSISLLGYALSFFGHFSHDTTIVALSFSFLNVLKSCDLVLFSLRKMQKKKKNGACQNLLPHISTTGAPQNIIQPDSGSYSAGLQLLFWQFLVIGHVTNLPWPIGWALIGKIILVLFFFTFHQIRPHLGRTMTWTLKAVPDGRYNICAILFLLETVNFPFLDISFGPWNHHPTMLITILIFFWFFGYFIAIFHLEMMK